MSRISRRLLLANAAGLYGQVRRSQPKPKPERKPVITIQRKVSMLPPKPVDAHLTPLRQGSLPQRPAAPAEESPFHVRHYANLQINSRLPGALGQGEWAIKWTADVPGAVASVIRGDDQILCQWPGSWRLYDGNGKQLKEEYSGQSPLVIDPRARLVQLVTATQSWEGRLLQTGELMFRNALPYDENYAWSVLLRAGARMMAFAAVRPPFRHGGLDKGSSLVQMLELGVPMQTDAGKLVQNLTKFEALMIDAADPVAAALPDAIVMAADGAILRINTNLEVSGFSGSVLPKFMSLDEAGWMYLLQLEETQRNLLVITADGVHGATWPLPREVSDPIMPPILGYDRRIYLLNKRQLACLSPQAQVEWVKSAPGAISAGVTTDGQVLVATTNALLAYDNHGESRTLCKFDRALSSPPAYTSKHEILVGGEGKLYCLAKKG